MPPGDGTTVSREGALAALVRGKTRKSLLGGVPGGVPLIELTTRPAAVTIYVSLPPPGTHRNDTRYPVAIVGGGYRGILESPSTRIPGLVSIADIAPTVVALADDEDPRIGSTPGTPADLRELDRTLRRQSRARNPAIAILAFSAIALAVLALLVRSPAVARACVLASPLALAVAIALVRSRADVAGRAPHGARAAHGLTRRRRRSALRTGARSPSPSRRSSPRTSSCSSSSRPGRRWPRSGPHRERAAASTDRRTSRRRSSSPSRCSRGRRSACAGSFPSPLLSLVTVGWSKAGADGGGLVVVAAGCAVLGMRLATGRLTVRAVAVAGRARRRARPRARRPRRGHRRLEPRHAARRRRAGRAARRARQPRAHLGGAARVLVARRARVRDRDRSPRHSRHPPPEIRRR